MKTVSTYAVNPVANITGLPAAANWIKITKQYSDFSAAGLTNDIEILQLVPKGVIHACIVRNTAAFTGGLVASTTLSVGITGLLTKYATASSVFGGASIAGVFNNIGCESFSTSTSIRAAMITTVGLINTLTAGSVDVYLLISVMP